MVNGWWDSSLRVMAHDFTLYVKGADLTWVDEGEEGEYTNAVSGYQREDDVFVQAIKTGDCSEIHSDYADGVRTLAVTVAANESAQAGGEVVRVAELFK